MNYEFLPNRPILTDIAQSDLEPIRNIGGGDCLYYAIMDSVLYWLEKNNELFKEISEIKDKIGNSKCDKAQHEFRQLLVRKIQDKLKDDSLTDTQREKLIKSQKRIKQDREWGEIDEIEFIANQFNICILIYSDKENIWTIQAPFVTDGGDHSCKDYIVIKNTDNNEHWEALKYKQNLDNPFADLSDSDSEDEDEEDEQKKLERAIELSKGPQVEPPRKPQWGGGLDDNLLSSDNFTLRKQIEFNNEIDDMDNVITREFEEYKDKFISIASNFKYIKSKISDEDLKPDGEKFLVFLNTHAKNTAENHVATMRQEWNDFWIDSELGFQDFILSPLGSSLEDYNFKARIHTITFMLNINKVIQLLDSPTPITCPSDNKETTFETLYCLPNSIIKQQFDALKEIWTGSQSNPSTIFQGSPTSIKTGDIVFFKDILQAIYSQKQKGIDPEVFVFYIFSCFDYIFNYGKEIDNGELPYFPFLIQPTSNKLKEILSDDRGSKITIDFGARDKGWPKFQQVLNFLLFNKVRGGTGKKTRKNKKQKNMKKTRKPKKQNKRSTRKHKMQKKHRKTKSNKH